MSASGPVASERPRSRRVWATGWTAGLTASRRPATPVKLVFAAVALWTLVPLFTLVGHSGVFDGGYGIDLPDQMQYMAFIRDAGAHGLISNLFDVARSSHLLLDPGFALSGLAWRLGASIQVALLLWIPVALAALWVGFHAYARRLLGADQVAVAVALLLAFFFFSPAQPLAHWLHGSANLQFGTTVVAVELFAGAYAWGAVPAISIALMPVFFLACERVLDPAKRRAGHSPRRYQLAAAIAGMFSSWLHPWQGMVLLATLAGLVLWGRFHRRYLALALPVVLTAAPLAYFAILSRTHSAFGAAGSLGSGYSHFGWWFAAGVAPLLLALPGYVGRPIDLQERLLRLWPLAALVVYVALDRTWFYHALDGLTLPLSILAVRGWRRLRLPRTAAAAVILALTVPGLVWVVQELVQTRDGNFFRAGERHALAYLSRDRVPGAVLAAVTPLGQAVPGYTGRQTWVGHYEWTPDMGYRVALAQALFDGRLGSAQAAALVRVSRVRFLAEDCAAGRVNLLPLLGPLIVSVRRFGCATVYEVRSSG